MDKDNKHGQNQGYQGQQGQNQAQQGQQGQNQAQQGQQGQNQGRQGQQGQQNQGQQGQNQGKQGQQGQGLNDVFKCFAQNNDKDSNNGESINQKNVENWLEKANLMGDKGSITSSDLSTAFQKIAKGKERINMPEFQQIVQDLAQSKKMQENDLMSKLTNASPSGQSKMQDVMSAGRDAAKNLMGYGKGQDASKGKDAQFGGKGASGKEQDASQNVDPFGKDMDAMKKDMDPMNKNKDPKM